MIGIDYIPIEDFVRLLPHEDVSRIEVAEMVRRFKNKPQIKPITVFGDYILDGHHRWNAVKLLFENDRKWKDKTIPVCYLEDFDVLDGDKDDIFRAAEAGELMGYKSTHTMPRGPEAKLHIKNKKK